MQRGSLGASLAYPASRKVPISKVAIKAALENADECGELAYGQNDSHPLAGRKVPVVLEPDEYR